MEFLDGWTLDDLDLTIHRDVISRVASIFFSSWVYIRQDTGPLGGGNVRDTSDDSPQSVFHSIDDSDTRLNKRLEMHKNTIDIRLQKLVLCQIDLCRRNRIMLPDRVIGLVDFDVVGFYPSLPRTLSLKYLNPFDAENTPFLPGGIGTRVRLEQTRGKHGNVDASYSRCPIAVSTRFGSKSYTHLFSCTTILNGLNNDVTSGGSDENILDLRLGFSTSSLPPPPRSEIGGSEPSTKPFS